MSVEYKILHNSNLHPLAALAGLEEEVEEFLNKGWRTVGGVSMTEYRILQAIQRENTSITSTGPR